MNYREIRRQDRKIPEDEALEILERAEYGVLSTSNADGTPYAIPLSHCVIDRNIYFHCAKTGHKLENILARPDVCFCAVGNVKPVIDKGFTSLYESAVVFGKASMVDDIQEKRAALLALSEKYFPGMADKAKEEINASISRTAVVRISIDHITGKSKR